MREWLIAESFQVSMLVFGLMANMGMKAAGQESGLVQANCWYKMFKWSVDSK